MSVYSPKMEESRITCLTKDHVDTREQLLLGPELSEELMLMLSVVYNILKRVDIIYLDL